MRDWKSFGGLAITAAVGLCACSPGDAERPVNPPIGNVAGAGGTDSVILPVAGSGPFEVGGLLPCSAGGPPPISLPPGLPLGEPSPQFSAPTAQLDKAPPPISGGTLLTSADGLTLIAADPDRDAVYVIDVAKRALVRRIELSPSDEPGRVVQDKAGTVHVALRGGRGIASFALGADSPVRRSELCDLPRGIAYDGAADRLYLACADGALVQVDASTGTATKKVELGRDLRDVIVRGSQLFVTRFRSAELLRVDMNAGQVMATHVPPSTVEVENVVVPEEPVEGAMPVCGGRPVHVESRMNTLSSEVAWRAVDVPGLGVAMLHQRAGDAEVRVAPGGYGGGGSGCASGIVHGAVSFGDEGSSSIDLMQPGLFVDLAVDPTGALLALANPGGWQTSSAVMLFTTPSAEQTAPGARMCMAPTAMVPVEGQPTAVSFVSPWMLAVQEREPAAISFYDTRTQAPPLRLDLNQPSRNDTGHALFHLTTSAGVACASCHAEASDDGHVWTFQGIGPRRTQNLRGGILGSEPFHWNGDMQDFPTLVNEVFVGRMSAPMPRPEQADALAHWIDRQPVLHAAAVDSAAVTRGKALFESEAVGCTKCHAGARLSNNQSADVGTGVLVQVPSLRAVSFRAPFMHDGCAKTLNDRFAACGGGDKHGHTSQLQATQVLDLVAYLESL